MKSRCKILRNFTFEFILLAKFESEMASGCQKYFAPYIEEKLK
jgi:hypothetical protein